MKNKFRVTGSLWGESTGHRWIPLTKAMTRSIHDFFDVRMHKRLIWDAIVRIMTSL